MKIAVIVPIYNSDKYLQDFFTALLENKFSKDDKVLLIDNGSTDKSYSLCEKVAQENDFVELLSYHEKASSYAARNFGVKNANADVLVFTDSDTKPSPNWLESIRNNIDRGVVIAGRIQLDIIDPKSIWENYDTIAHLNSESNVKNHSIATANMAVYKNDFERVGYFEERFSGGDYEWSQRAAKCGMSIRFVEDALIHHPTRKTFDQILKKEQRIAYGMGNHYRINDKSYFVLRVKFFLKIFKFDTNVKYIRRLKQKGIGNKNLLRFNHFFMIIRFEQYKYCKLGYNEVDVRMLKIK